MLKVLATAAPEGIQSSRFVSVFEAKFDSTDVAAAVARLVSEGDIVLDGERVLRLPEREAPK